MDMESANVLDGDSLDEEEEDEEDEEVATVVTAEEALLSATADEDGKHCWVCFASEEDDPQAQWTHPCRSVYPHIFEFSCQKTL